MSNKQKDEPILADEMLGKSEAFVIKHKKTITTIVIALVACVLGYIMYQKLYAEPKEKEAMTALHEAMYSSVIGKNAEALESAIAVVEQYDGTEAANVARLIAAGLKATEEGNYEEAIKYFEEYKGNDNIMAPHVKHMLGNCYAHTGNTEKAMKLILEAAEEANNEAVTPTCWRDLAAMHEQQGNKEEAVKYYNKVKTEYPNSPLVVSGEIEKQLNSIK